MLVRRVRLVAEASLDAAAERLGQQLSHGLVWLECGESEELPSDALLDGLARLAETGEAMVVASAPRSMIDLLFSRLDQPSAQILIEPDDMQRAGALAGLVGRGRLAA